MPRICVRSLLFFALLAVPASPVFMRAADTPAVAVSGTIFSTPDNARIASASVALWDSGGAILQQSVVGASGEFSFQALRPGHYLLKVQASGFQPAEVQVDLSSASLHGVAVTLRPASSAQQLHSRAKTISAHELRMPEAARQLLDSGAKKLYSEKNGRAALQDFQSAIKASPDFYEAHYLAGMAYLSLQNSCEAEKCFRKSVDLSHQQYADANIALGSLLLQRGEEREGEPLLRQGLAANPGSWPGQFALGEFEMAHEHVDAALAAAEKAAAIAPAQPAVYRLLAVIHLRQKNFSALLSDLDDYLQLDPDSPAGERARELRAQTERQLADAKGPAVSARKMRCSPAL